MIAQHEQQHDETMLATHQLRVGPPVLRRAAAAAPRSPGWRRRGAGARRRRSPWAPPPSRGRWTTSAPRTPSTCPPYVIDAAPVTNGGYREFIADGGYDEPRWWTEAGWRHRTEARR